MLSLIVRSLLGGLVSISNRWVFLVIVAASLAAISPARGQPVHVQPQLVANVTSIEPGKSFLLGVLLKIDPGWHIYWKNPGVGIPTKVKFSLPPGFEVGELQYPTPELLQEPGNIIANANTGECFLAGVFGGMQSRQGHR
jgi:DsbC/DsbD-like thiol-disulfide interchange protein